MKKILFGILKFLAVFILVIICVYAVGPRPSYESVDADMATVDVSLEELPALIADRERGVANLKPDNESRIIWADSIRKTDWAVVYLHGFSASPMEGNPIHIEFARRYGMNIYIPRLAGHGLDDEDSFLHLTPADLVQSAKEAIAIGQLLGKKVLLMGCSTGCTLAVYLAANNPELADALILYSPNIDLEDKSANLLPGPWGLELGRSIAGERREITAWKGTPCEQYWTMTYRLEGIIALRVLLNETMTEETFSKINMPYYVGYYYKNEEEKDFTISVDAINDFVGKTSTPESKRKVCALPDVKAHVMISDLQSKDLESVRKTTYEFAEEIIGLAPMPAVD